MHRKNRRDTGCGSGTEQGVDINRNYGFNWGANDTGSSPDPCYATFRGEEPFSEPETRAVRDFINEKNFVNVLHYHSYGNMYIHPYGDSSLPDEPDLTIYRELAQIMADHNNFNVGTGFEMVGYTVNGDAVDWSYGEKNIIANFPDEAEYLVVLYAAIKATEYMMLSEEDQEVYAPQLATLKQDYAQGLTALKGGQ